MWAGLTHYVDVASAGLDSNAPRAIVDLTGICRLVFEDFDQAVEERRQNGPQDWSNPVDPVVMVEVPGNHFRPERSSRVEGRAGPEPACLCQTRLRYD